MTILSLKLSPTITVSLEQFWQICEQNSDLQLEWSSQGELIIMPPTGGETGRSNANITAQLWLWNDQKQLGEVFDSSCGFILNNGAVRSPDCAWISTGKWQSISPSQRQKFLPLCPDFVIEILSPTDNVKITRAKMQEYMDDGCMLGWLINCSTQEVEVYTLKKDVEILTHPMEVSGGEILPGFTLNLNKIW